MIGVFFYLLIAGIVLQKLLLPATPWYAGDGLLGGGDWIYFHGLAKDLAHAIESEGWAAWELRPEGQAPSGVAAALYALTGVHEPWIVLPVNAALFSAAVACACVIFRALAPVGNVAFVALLPFLLMPSMVLFWGQLHKDVWALFGVLAVLVVWVRVIVQHPMHWVYGLLLLLLGNLSIWLVRPYALQLLLLGQMGMWILIVGVMQFNKSTNYRNSILTGLLAIALTASVFFCRQNGCICICICICI